MFGFFVRFPETDLPPLRPRGYRTSEKTNLELLQRDPNHRKTAATFAERMLRDLLCFFAPLIGLLAAAMTTNRTYLFALPTAGALVLCAQFLGSYSVKSLAGLGLYGTMASLVVLSVGMAVAVVIAIQQHKRGFIRPLGARV